MCTRCILWRERIRRRPSASTGNGKSYIPTDDIQLVIIESPYRSLIGPLLSYIDALDRQSPDDTVTIVLPEFLPASPWEYLLHNQSALG